MAETINVLTHLDTLGVSLVKRGANRKRFAVAKSEDLMDEKSVELLTAVLKEAGYDGEKDLAELIQKQQLGEKEQNAIKGALRILNAFRDNEKIRALADMMAQAVGYPKPEAEPEAAPEAEPELAAAPMALAEKAKKEEEKDKMKPGYPAPMMKALEAMPEAQRAALSPVVEAIAKEYSERITKAEERAAETDKILKSERDDRLTKEFIAKAERDFVSLPGKPEELGLILKALHDVNPDLEKKVEALFKSVQTALKESALFAEQGRSGEGDMSDSPWSEIQKGAATAQ